MTRLALSLCIMMAAACAVSPSAPTEPATSDPALTAAADAAKNAPPPSTEALAAGERMARAGLTALIGDPTPDAACIPGQPAPGCVMCAGSGTFCIWCAGQLWCNLPAAEPAPESAEQPAVSMEAAERFIAALSGKTDENRFGSACWTANNCIQCVDGQNTRTPCARGARPGRSRAACCRDLLTA